MCASVSDPRSWGTLATARHLAELRAYSGCGIVSSAVPELVFLDLDRCLDDATGEPINNDAARLLETCGSTYAEITPSGAGLRIIGTARSIEATLSRKATTAGGLALEIYKAAPRYLTVTGRRYRDHPDALADIGDTVLDLVPLLVASPDAAEGHDRCEDAILVRRIVTGAGYHTELCALAARHIGRGMSATATAATLCGLMLAHQQSARDARWQDRFASIDRLVASAARKYAAAAGHRRALGNLALRMMRDRVSPAAVRSTILAQAAAHGIEASRAENIVMWAARIEIKRRGHGDD